METERVMHLFDFLTRSKSRAAAAAATAAAPASSASSASSIVTALPAPPGPEELRRLIFSAVAAGDSERLSSLCRDHEKGILESVGDWAKVPDELQSNPAAMRWYGEGLRAIARFCAESLDRPHLFQRLEELGLATPGVN